MSSKAPRTARKKKLKAPSLQQVMAVSFALAKEVSLEMREEELVGTFAAALRELLPGRLLCLRIVDPRTLQLTSLVADGPLAEDVQARPLCIKRSAMKRTRIAETAAQNQRLQVSDSYAPVFRGSRTGFSVPLVASGDVFGLFNVEYPEGQELAAADEPLVIPLANQLSVALRNQNLLGETRYYRDYLRQLIDVANALIVVVDRERKIAVMNAAMQRFTGWTDELIGKTLEIFKNDGVEEPRLATLMLRGFEGGEVQDREVVVLCRDGSQARALFNTSVVRAPDGSVDGVLAIGRDIERVRSLERQVIQAEKLATLGQLAAGVVHELNNPLTSITVYGDLIAKHLEGSENLDKAKKIVEAAGRIQKLTRDLMSYARPGGDFESVGINGVVRQALVFCEHILHRGETVVELRLADEQPHVRAIRGQLHQVLINLLTNACHALPAPGQTIAVSTQIVGDEVIVEIADSGVGIDESLRRRIFEPFFTTKKEGKGTGLGLSIVKNIIEGHGGRIGFESRVGEGTTFRICLPLARDSGEIVDA
jgi:PAS domain S-box-containing protein